MFLFDIPILILEYEAHFEFTPFKPSSYLSVYVLTEESPLCGQHYQCPLSISCWQDIMSSVAFTPKPI